MCISRKLVPIAKSVAMKFIETGGEFGAENEHYEIYTYLNAINNSRVEIYGIPTVYYYGTWEVHNIMAIILFDHNVLSEYVNCKMNEVDLLIIMREFVNGNCTVGLFRKIYQHYFFLSTSSQIGIILTPKMCITVTFILKI